MNCCQQATPEYFDAIIANDIEKLKNIEKHSKYDNRATDQEKKIFKGFAGIHYAILNKNFEIFEYLFNEQWKYQTQEDIQMTIESNTLFTKSCKFSVAAETNILILAFIANNEKVVEFIVNKIDQDQQYAKLLKQANRFNLSLYTVLCLSLMPIARELMIKYIAQFNQINNGDLCPLMTCAYFCKYEQFKMLAELAESDEKFKKEFVEQLKQLNYKQQKFIQVAEQDEQDESFNITKEQRQEFVQYAKEIYNKYNPQESEKKTEQIVEKKEQEEEKEKETVEVAAEVEKEN